MQFLWLLSNLTVDDNFDISDLWYWSIESIIKSVFACPFFCAFKYEAVGLCHFILMEVEGEMEVEVCHWIWIM